MIARLLQWLSNANFPPGIQVGNAQKPPTDHNVDCWKRIYMRFAPQHPKAQQALYRRVLRKLREVYDNVYPFDEWEQIIRDADEQTSIYDLDMINGCINRGCECKNYD